jgi:class 3 adenylate cyclase
MVPEQQQLEAGIAALEGQRAVLGDAVVDAALEGLKARLADLRAPAPEPAQSLKQVSILFLDVVGSTALSQHLDPEEISALMDSLLSRGTAIVEAHRGKVLQYAGDNLLAAFGAEQAFEDDAERAVRCGLELLALGRSLGENVRVAHGRAGIDVRVGIHSGGVLLGGGVDEDGSIRGQAVNIAARMEQTAPAGALRISHDTYRLLRGGFEVAAQEPLRVKGVDQPVRSYLVLRTRPLDFRMGARGIEGVETRMIGRDAELRTLQDAFEGLTVPGAGLQALLVVGEAGVGKSRLLHEFGSWLEARADRRHIFQARATPQMQGRPYGLVHDLFARRLQIVDGDDMEVAKRKLEHGLMPLLADTDGEEESRGPRPPARPSDRTRLQAASRHVSDIRDDAREIRSRAFHAAALALRRIHAEAGRPIVFELDDLHWADDGSLDFIAHVAQVDRDVPLLLLGLTRPTLFERRADVLRMAGEVAASTHRPAPAGPGRQPPARRRAAAAAAPMCQTNCMRCSWSGPAAIRSTWKSWSRC